MGWLIELAGALAEPAIYLVAWLFGYYNDSRPGENGDSHPIGVLVWIVLLAVVLGGIFWLTWRLAG